MMLADKNHRFLFEIRPDVFPEGFLTRNELTLWTLFYQDQSAKLK